VSLERTNTAPATESSIFTVLGDATTQISPAAPLTASHDRWVLLVNALTQLVGSWGNTLRLAFLAVIVRMLVGPISWDQLAALFKLGS
jgi:hypothetical protein